MRYTTGMIEWPRLLSDFTPAPGIIKDDYEDFVVEELPLYEASGEGTHTYFLVEKRGLTTMQAVHDIARELDVRRVEIGYAGLKDARAVTRQWMSVEHVEPSRLEALSIPRICILDVTRHRNKLKLGHLRANAFTIRVRQTEPTRLVELQDALRILSESGVPNYFGQQRFGGRGDSWEVGREVLRGNLDAALDIVLGRPGPEDSGDILRARELYEAGQFGQAIGRWPGMFRDERRALKTLVRTKGRKKRGFLAIDRSLRRFYVSAYQSYLFNQVLAQRMETGLSMLMPGDLAELHDRGAVFEVIDTAVEQPRADAFEISPTGPIFGYRMSEPSGKPGEIEQSVLEQEHLTRSAFRAKGLRLKGGRRALRFRPADARISLGAGEDDAYLELRFTLPKGCYATCLLRELFTTPAGSAMRVVNRASGGRTERLELGEIDGGNS